MLIKPSLKMPLAVGLIALLLAVGIGLSAWIWYQGRAMQKAVRISCVTLVTPLIALHHAMASLQDPKNTDASVTDDFTLSDKLVFSKNVDLQTVKVAKFMTSLDQDGDVPTATMNQVESQLSDLADLYAKEASNYLDDCIALNKKVHEQCGSTIDGSVENKKCMVAFHEQWSQLMTKYLPARSTRK